MAAQAPIWESPKDDEGITLKKPTTLPPDDDDGRAPVKSTTPPVNDDDGRAKSTTPPADDDDGRALETFTALPPVVDDGRALEKSTTPPGWPSNVDDKFVVGFKDLAIAPEESPVKTKFLSSKRVTRATNKVLAILLPKAVDVTALLAESYAHTKSTTKASVEIITFREFGAKLNKHFAIKKLSDGSFGDVYKLVTHSSTKSTSKNKLELLGGGVLKIIPLAAKTGLGSRTFSRVENVLSEVKVLRALDSLHGFIRFRDVHVVQGRYPDSFVNAYVDFANNVRPSDTTNPAKFTDSQIHAIIDMDNAGTDLGSFESLNNIFQVYDIFWATVIVLANGEKNAEFEARDMHNGNICVRPFRTNGTMDVPDDELSGWSESQARHLGLTEIRVTLIDYTLSRACLEDKSIAFQDLKENKFLFTKPGQKPRNSQQVAYDRMRDAVRAASASNPHTSKKEDWSLFVPRTNVAWLYYLLELLLEVKLNIPEASNAACVRAQLVMRERLEKMLDGLKIGAIGGKKGAGSAEAVLEGVLQSGLLGREEVEWYVKRLESEQ